MLSNKLKHLAIYSGISFDNFDAPVVDRQLYLKRFADEVIIHCAKIAEEESKKPKKDQNFKTRLLDEFSDPRPVE